MAATTVLVFAALWVAWRPAETFASTPLALALALFALVPWAWRRRGEAALRIIGLAPVAALVLVSGLTGADPAGALVASALAATVAALAWCAARQRPPAWAIPALALGLSALGVLAIWQVAFGLEAAAARAAALPEAVRPDGVARLAEGRAFASLILPGHLAVLLGTAFPLLLEAAAIRRWRVPAAAGLALAAAGIALSRSALGAGLAVLAAVAVLVGRDRRRAVAAAVVGLLLVAAVVAARGDLLGLGPLRLRAENWRVGLWVWSTAPISGVGFGGYGQASLAVPFATANLPEHAHSLPLEWLAELGLAGAALAVLGAVGLGLVVRRCWRVRPALAAAVAVVPLHNLVDFSFWNSGVVAPWAVLLGWAVAHGRGSEPVARPPGRFRAAVLATAACGVALAAFHLTSAELVRAAATEPDQEARLAMLRTSHRLAPWRVAPLFALGSSAAGSGQPALASEALRELHRWRWLRPRSAAFASLCARLELARGEPAAAAVEAWSAARARPADPRPASQSRLLIERLSEARGVPPG